MRVKVCFFSSWAFINELQNDKLVSQWCNQQSKIRSSDLDGKLVSEHTKCKYVVYTSQQWHNGLSCIEESSCNSLVVANMSHR